MPNVLIDKDKLDVLANAISNKSGEALTLTLDEMVDAVDGISTGGGGTPILETVTKTYTASEQGAVTDTITPSNGYDGIGEVDVTVNAIPMGTGQVYVNTEYYNDNGRKWQTNSYYQMTQDGWVNGTSDNVLNRYNAIASGTSVTPTESSQTIGGVNYMMESAVTVNAIPSNYVGSGITQRTSSDLSASGATVSVPSGYYASNASKAVSSGTEGTPTATKGTVTNHSVSITPSVTNSAGYISGGTHNGTAVSVSASELVSGTLSITANTTGQDVTNYKYVDVAVSGGGGGSTTVGTTTKTLSAAASSIQFTGLSGQPTSFVITSTTEQTTGGTKVVGVVYDGTSCHGMDITSEAAADTGFSQSYNNGTLTVTGTTASFQATTYKLVYSYGGSSADVGTVDVQVGSGATSITFTGLTDEPIYWSCVFKSSFSTSSGYQRTMMVANDGSSTYGFALDSSAKALTSWSASYSAGSLVITSTGTNNGGYFHQPGYYQLTYAVGEAPPITVEALNVTQNGTYTAPTGKAYSPVTVNVSGGGSSKNAQAAQSTTRTTTTTYTQLISLTCASAGTYDVYWTTTRSSTSGTWGSQLYLGDTAYGTAQTGSWSNHVQNIHLTGVQIAANQAVAVRARSRGSNYYAYVGTLAIIQTS